MVLDKSGDLRFEDERSIWKEREREFGPQSMVEIFNRDGRATLSLPVGNKSHPSYYVWDPNDERVDVRPHALRTLPIRLAFRALNKEISAFDPERLTLTDDSAMIGTDKVLVLKHTGRDPQKAATENDVGKSQSYSLIWVNPARDLMPVRWASVRDGIETLTIDISHSRDEKHGWVPTSWTTTMRNKAGKLQVSEKHKVTQYAINDPIPASEFKVDLPVGTWVHNSATDENYILRANGEKRHVLPGEYDGSNYEKLRDSDTPKTAPERVQETNG